MLYFKTRRDSQIKHMGYRIELEEIETCLNLIKGINRSAVIYKKGNKTFGKIIAFVSVQGGLRKESIESELTKNIPVYMIPNQIKLLDTIPINSNGKIDKQTLAAME